MLLLPTVNAPICLNGQRYSENALNVKPGSGLICFPKITLTVTQRQHESVMFGKIAHPRVLRWPDSWNQEALTFGYAPRISEEG